MKLQTFAEVEHSVGGRPKVKDTKVRMSFYASQSEAKQLRLAAEKGTRPVSQLVRLIISEYLALHAPYK